MTTALDPKKRGMAVFIHPTRQQFEEPFVTAAFLQLKRKLHLRVESSGFHFPQPYCATVLIQGVNRHMEGLAMMTAIRVLSDSPIGFDVAENYTFHVELGNGRPFIGLVAAEVPLDKASAAAHFVARGDEGH